jgi:hypothetical protein
MRTKRRFEPMRPDVTRCDARVTVNGTAARCGFRAKFAGPNGEHVCGIHLRVLERGGELLKAASSAPAFHPEESK